MADPLALETVLARRMPDPLALETVLAWGMPDPLALETVLARGMLELPLQKAEAGRSEGIPRMAPGRLIPSHCARSLPEAGSRPVPLLPV